MIGTVIGNYRIVRELGQGGMGAVYEGIDVMVERPVAVKMLRAEIARNPEVIERFRVEAVTLARLNHPCIATLYSFFREGENYYMVMEFVRGDTLENMIRRSGRLAPEYTAEILAQTLDGMAHAHSMGVLHRDIKPANIMITTEGRVKVTDFGIARVLGSSRMTRDGRIIGTLEYLAPERIRGEEADIRSDLYSVGVVMYEAISGRLPFTADTDYDLMQAHLNQPPPSLLSQGLQCPGWVHTVLSRALAKSRDERFQSAEEFRDTLAAVASHPISHPGVTATVSSARFNPIQREASSSQAGVSSEPTTVPLNKKLPLKPIALAAGALVVLLGLFLIIQSYRSAQTETQTMVASSPQPTPTAPEPLPPAEPKKQAAPADTGITLPLELFQNKPVSEIPREPLRTGPKEKRNNMNVPKDVIVPGTAIEPEPPTEAGTTPSTPPLLDTAVPEPPGTADPLPAKKVESEVSAPISKEAKTLQDIRRIFVARMPNQLDEYVKSEIEKQLWGRVRLAARREDADAVFQGDIENSADANIGSAILMDLKGNVVLWKAEAGDKSSLFGIAKRGGSKKIAERLIEDLKKKMNY
ncbi:MAG: serine/threonine protein kinase [Acidobacteria bacterium]|nr:serine/threonine protein kinase [Acidobacteriota bacterium]